MEKREMALCFLHPLESHSTEVKGISCDTPPLGIKRGASESRNPRRAELGGRCFDIALPVLADEHRAATLTSVGCRRGEPEVEPRPRSPTIACLASITSSEPAKPVYLKVNAATKHLTQRHEGLPLTPIS